MIVSFVSNKGGTGKTTACVNVAACLSKKGKSVLVIDLDPLASATAYLGLKSESFEGYFTQAIATGEKKLEETIFEIENSGIHIAPSRRGEIFDKMKKNFLSKEVEKVINDYAFILIDTLPGFDDVVREAISVSDTPIAVLNESVFALENLPLLRDLANKEGKELNCAVVSMISKKSGFSRNVVKTITNQFKKSFIIPYDKRIPQSQAIGLPLLYMGKSSKALKDYDAIAEFLIGRT